MTSFKETETLDFPGPAGRIEGILNLPADGKTPRAAAVICHAHPLHGGMMHFKVIFRAAKALQSQGIAVLRFNFRGVGRSEGEHDRGVGEQDDARAALTEIEARFPTVPLLLGGFSFGSAMAAKVAVDESRVKAVLVLGFPITRVDTTADLAQVLQPRLFVQGSEDEFGPGSQIRKLVAPLPEPKRLDVIEGADHFFTGRLDDFQAPIEDWGGLESLGSEMTPFTRLNARDAVLLVVDMQERLLPVIHDFERVIANVRLLLRAANQMDLPVLMTTQYSRGLGPLHAEVAELAPQAAPFDKLSFSCFGESGFATALAATGRRSLLLCGVEAHICVLQTGLDALASHYGVHLASDAVGSRTPQNAELGRRRLDRAGAILSSTEMAIYELLGASGTPAFKALLPHFK